MERIEFWVMHDRFEMRCNGNATERDIANAWTMDCEHDTYLDLGEAIAAYEKIPVDTWECFSNGIRFLMCEVAGLECVVAEYDEDYNTSDYIRSADELVDWRKVPGGGFRSKEFKKEN